MWAYLAAYRGQEQQCREIVETTISRAQERGEGFDIDGALYSVAILYLGLSQYPEALAAASSARQHDDVGVLTHILNETSRGRGSLRRTLHRERRRRRVAAASPSVRYRHGTRRGRAGSGASQ